MVTSGHYLLERLDIRPFVIFGQDKPLLRGDVPVFKMEEVRELRELQCDPDHQNSERQYRALALLVLSSTRRWQVMRASHMYVNISHAWLWLRQAPDDASKKY